VTVEMLKENTGVAEKIEKSLTLFVEAVELSSDLEVIGTAFPSKEEVFVIRDYSKTEGIEGAYKKSYEKLQIVTKLKSS